MKKLFIASILASLILIPFRSFAGYYDPIELSTWAGCKAQVVTSDLASPTSSFYSFDDNVMYLGTDPNVPPMIRALIYLHEIGHCLQAQDGTLGEYYTGPLTKVQIELDADRRAADLACRYGLDGKALLHDLFVWAYRTFGYEGDYGHGSISQRIAQGERAEACQVRAQES